MMLLMGEQVTFGPNQTAEYSAAIERQHAYEAGKAAEFDTGSGGLPLSVVPYVTGGALGMLTSLGNIGGSGTPTHLYGQVPGETFPWPPPPSGIQGPMPE